MEKIFSYRPDIDGLRGIAVLSVIVYHLNQSWLPGGFVGVDIFFVISGYVVTGSLLKHNPQDMLHYLLGFYARRIKRILPALIFCILGTITLTVFLIEPSETKIIYNSGLSALLGMSNLYFIESGRDYFGLDQELNPLTHTWSLGVEEQFYFVFPLIIAVIYRSKTQDSKRLQNILFITLGLLIASLAISSKLSVSNLTWAYYLMPSRFWELAAGSILFISTVQGSQLLEKKKSWVMLILQIVAIGLLGIALWVTTPTSGFPFPWALVTVIGSTLVITTGLDETSFLRRLLSIPLLTFIGKISYSLYLWHWPVFTMFKWTVGLEGITKPSIALAVAIGLALASYYWIEKPIRYWRSSDFKVVFATGTISLFSSGILICLIITLGLGKLFFLGYKVPESTWRNVDSITENSQCSSFNYYEKRYRKTDDYRDCTLIIKGKNTVSLLGDSHAESLIPLMQEVSKRKAFSTFAATHSGCPLLLSLRFSRQDGLNTDSCVEYTKNEIERVVALSHPGDVLFLSYRLRSYFLEEPLTQETNKSSFMTTEGKRISFDEARSLLKEDLSQIAYRLNQKGASLLILAPLPENYLSPKQCLIKWLSQFNDDCSVDKVENLANRQPIMKILLPLEKELPNVFIWDSFDKLCPDKKCLPIEQGKFIFRDKNHLSVDGSTFLTDHLLGFLKTKNLIH